MKLQSASNVRCWAYRVGQVLVVGLIVYFWARSLSGNWEQLIRYRPQFRPELLAGALMFLLLEMMLLTLSWRWMLGFLGVRRPWMETTRIWGLSQIGRYLPGGIWDVAGRLVLSSRAGFPRKEVSVSILVEIVLQTLSAIMVFLASLLFWEDTSRLWMVWWGLLLIPFGMAALHPRLLNRLIRFIASFLKTDYSPLQFRYSDIFILLLVHVGTRLLVGTSFFLFATAVYPWDIGRWPAVVGIFSAAWVAGFLVFFVPMGLGVREGVLTFLMVGFMPIVPATIAALGFRVLIAVRDLAFAGFGTLLPQKAEASEERWPDLE